jgi:TonB-linked SusC/RagA family outer membrane protein
MRNFTRLLLAGFLLFQSMLLMAQEKTVSGVIRDADDNSPLSGVSVSLKGSTRGIQTDASGAFSIQAKKGDFLQISYVGYEMQQVRIGDGNTISVNLKSISKQMGEVVVVAMDIKRNPRELGYSVQKIGGTEIAQTQRENFLNSLQGRVAGLSITPTNGQAGASSSIVLRGFNSLSLSNSPLFVVDGIILDNSTMNETSNGGSGLGLASDRPNRNNDYSNRISDLNPNDIESVTVLKGPEATALYGSQASAGAIVITTRKAVPGKIGVTYDNSFRAQKVIRFEELDNNFSPGTNGVAGSTFTYFGPAYPADTKRYDNIHSFYRTGFTQTHNISADIGTKNAGFRISGSWLDQTSVVPTNDYKKVNLRISNTTKIGKYIDIIPAIQYIKTNTNKPLRGAGGYLLGLYIWPVDNDVTDYLDVKGNKKVLYAADPNAETDNPLFNVSHNHSADENERIVATFGININPFSWLSIAGRFGYDTYKSSGYTFYHPNSSQYSAATKGYLDNYWRKYNGYNHTITATARRTMGKWSGRLMLGTMWQDYRTQMYAVAGSNLKDSVSTDSSNTSPNTRIRLLRNNFGQWNESITRQIAYFGEAGIGWNNVLFLSYTHRFESASIFTAANRNYNYPGISFSGIVSDLFPAFKNTFINFWKVRASLAGTARLADPYMNQSVFVNNFASSNGLAYSYGFYNNNPDLKPEKQKTYEIGTEIRLFKDLFMLDAGYYNTLCTDQISQGYRASYATGFILNTQNAASTRNQGIELTLDVNPVRKGDFTWNIRFNFNHMWSEVLKLPDAIQYEYYIADTWLYANARGGLIRNQPTTTLTGYHYTRNKNGAILINPTNGLPIVEQTFTIIGDRSPDFSLGTLNNIRYKNWSLSFLWDLKVGGDIFNANDMYLTIQGKSIRASDRKTPRVVDGVLRDGLENTDNPTKNNIVVTPYYTNAYYGATTGMPEEEYVQKDVNWLRLRDITINYSAPQSLVRKLKGFKSLGFFVTGNDLVLLTNYKGVDPAINGNTASSNGVGGFGFDYGNLPTSLSLNVGIRAGF